MTDRIRAATRGARAADPPSMRENGRMDISAHAYEVAAELAATGGQISGIIIAIAAVLIVAGGALFFFLRRRGRD
ncbi:LPXTG cell wall anchor domain-containing protein [Microbacterium karelineae]|uniref:LPXTG cell wall anchor domain-containing protein n=1 Tax=Microbacterium karelineae TaxID=2654283 RepID=UPI0012E9DD53|nr:LPXTG cell wall anchor domain-containing protein [Microbacterium karelineae]